MYMGVPAFCHTAAAGSIGRRLARGAIGFLIAAIICAPGLLLSGCGGGTESGSSPSAASTDNDSGEIASANEEILPDPEIGRQMFVHACATCHGTNAQGLPHQGADLRSSKFIAEKTDQQLLSFLQVGRPQNETTNPDGVLMPARGGNAALDDARLRDVIAYLRQIQQETGPVARVPGI